MPVATIAPGTICGSGRGRRNRHDGNGLISLHNAQVDTMSNYADGGLISVEAGALKYRNWTGIITTVAAA